ncbi:MAG: hypothetical protein K6F92_08565 [Lachnospiraceae bacterium]|nr:hypothetical protein [Lachnospiraceae bacterium]
MNTKKKIILPVVIVLMLVIVVCAYYYYKNSDVIADGTYKIVDNDDYPDAYIEAKGGNIVFRNIDLNEIYKDKLINELNTLIDRGMIDDMSEEEKNRLSDLNGIFVDDFYEIDYSYGTKTGTFTYNYACYAEIGIGRGFSINYDAQAKSITVMRAGINLTFEK